MILMTLDLPMTTAVLLGQLGSRLMMLLLMLDFSQLEALGSDLLFIELVTSVFGPCGVMVRRARLVD